jgi:hypothetical protein
VMPVISAPRPATGGTPTDGLAGPPPRRGLGAPHGATPFLTHLLTGSRLPRLTRTLTRVPRRRRAPGRRLWLMIRPFFTLVEYARLMRPSAHRFAARSRRACATVFLFTFGTTQRTTAGGRTTGGGGGCGSGGSGGGRGEGWGGGRGRGGGGGGGPATGSSFVRNASAAPPLKVVSKASGVVGKSVEGVFPVR